MFHSPATYGTLSHEFYIYTSVSIGYIYFKVQFNIKGALFIVDYSVIYENIATAPLDSTVSNW